MTDEPAPVRAGEEGGGAEPPAPFDAERAIQALPAAPGVYLMVDAGEKVLYVGKAASLRDRVRSYFRDSGDGRLQIPLLTERVRRIDHVVTSTEKEALLLENNLIKQHKPRFNVLLKDDKTYVNIVLSTPHEFPRIHVRRRPRPSEGRVFGPYVSAGDVRETVKQITKIFQLRTCNDHVFANRARPCLLYQLKRCTAPCVGYIDRERYAADVERTRMFLEGRGGELLRGLRARMEEAAEALEFERAATLRDQIAAIEHTLEKQMVTLPSRIDRDVFGMHREGPRAVIGVLNLRRGNLIGQTAFQLRDFRFEGADLWPEVLLQYYDGSRPVPREIVAPAVPEDAAVLEEILAERREGRVKITSPSRGVQRRLLEMARRNAETAFLAKVDAAALREEALAELQRRLRLKNFPRRIECFDISNISGVLAVGSMVVFTDGEPDRAAYRKFKIRTVEGPNDFAMMREVLARRYARMTEADRPDLIVIDGGKGQLGVARAALEELGIGEPDLISLAKDKLKDRGGGGKERTLERVFLPGRSNPVVLRQSSAPLHLLVRVRDESHRFAIVFHRSLRVKAGLRSVLDSIPGVGPAKRKALLRKFGSLRRIREASPEALAEVPGVTPALARTIHAVLHA